MPAAKLTPKLRVDLCELLRKGHYIHSACAHVGISRSTYKNWNARGLDARAMREEGHPVKRADLPYLEFVEATELARDYGEAWLVERTLEAAANPRDHGRWQAYMTILERSRPDRWARRSRDGGKDPVPAAGGVLDVSKLEPAKRRQLRQLLAELAPDDA